MVLAPRTVFDLILGFTNCSIDLVDHVCVVVVIVFNVVIVLVVVVEGVSKFFSFLETRNLELAFLDPCPSSPQQKNNTKLRKRRTASKKKAKNRFFRPQKPPKKFYAAVWRGRKI